MRLKIADLLLNGYTLKVVTTETFNTLSDFQPASWRREVEVSARDVTGEPLACGYGHSAGVAMRDLRRQLARAEASR